MVDGTYMSSRTIWAFRAGVAAAKISSHRGVAFRYIARPIARASRWAGRRTAGESTSVTGVPAAHAGAEFALQQLHDVVVVVGNRLPTIHIAPAGPAQSVGRPGGGEPVPAAHAAGHTLIPRSARYSASRRLARAISRSGVVNPVRGL